MNSRTLGLLHCVIILTIVEQLSDFLSAEEFECMKHCVLGAAPNTYTITKNWAEAMIYEEANDIPTGIFRPPIGKLSF